MRSSRTAVAASPSCELTREVDHHAVREKQFTIAGDSIRSASESRHHASGGVGRGLSAAVTPPTRRCSRWWPPEMATATRRRMEGMLHAETNKLTEERRRALRTIQPPAASSRVTLSALSSPPRAVPT